MQALVNSAEAHSRIVYKCLEVCAYNITLLYAKGKWTWVAMNEAWEQAGRLLSYPLDSTTWDYMDHLVSKPTAALITPNDGEPIRSLLRSATYF